MSGTNCGDPEPPIVYEYIGYALVAGVVTYQVLSSQAAWTYVSCANGKLNYHPAWSAMLYTTNTQDLINWGLKIPVISMTVTITPKNITWDGSILSGIVTLDNLTQIANRGIQIYDLDGHLILNQDISGKFGTLDVPFSSAGFTERDVNPTTYEVIVFTGTATSGFITEADDTFTQSITQGGQNIGPLRIMLEYCGDAIVPVILTPGDFTLLEANPGVFTVLDQATGQVFGSANMPLTSAPATYGYSQIAAMIAANTAGGGASCSPPPADNTQFDIIDKMANNAKLNASPIILSNVAYPSLVNYIAAGVGTEVNLEIVNTSAVSTPPNNTLDGVIAIIQAYVVSVINSVPHTLQTPVLAGVLDANGLKIDLSWAWVTGANTISLERSSDNGVSFQVLNGSLQVLTFDDDTVLPGGKYQYRIKEFDNGTLATSGYSNIVSVSVPSTPPVIANDQVSLAARNGTVVQAIMTDPEYQKLALDFANGGIPSLAGASIFLATATTSSAATYTELTALAWFAGNVTTPGTKPPAGKISTMEYLAALGLLVGIPAGIYLATSHKGSKKKKYVD